MPRGPIIVTLADGKDHLMIGGGVTGCGQLVPHGLDWQDSTTKPCKTCFPDGKVEAARQADESALIARQQEALGVEPVAERAPFEEGVTLAAPTVDEPEPTEEPEAEPKAAAKPAKKATKAG